MRNFIDPNRACGVGLLIVDRKCGAWLRHDHNAVLEANRAEAEHLAHCTECNPELVSNGRLIALWGEGVQVAG